jgi:coenzyme F420-0:L-glutamate ligase / coenzyme F420-1:gamma-L-glutamate ligase
VGELSLRSLPGLPEIAAGADLAQLIASSAQTSGRPLRSGQVVSIAHKAVSKAEGATVKLTDVLVGERARELAGAAAREGAAKDARVVQVVLDQAAEVLRAERGVLVCRTRHGFVCANAGVDASNVPGVETVVLLPRDPDASARRIRGRLRELTGASVGVVIGDSFGRAWRHGQCDVAVGCAGLTPLEDWRGRPDGVGRELRATLLALADAIAASAELARAKDSGEPVVVVEGLERLVTEADGPGAAALVRPLEEDLFR